MKKLLAVFILLACTLAVFGQEKQKVAILPFTGGPDGDGAAIAGIISNQHDIREAFDIVPCTDEVNALVAGKEFGNNGYADSDALAILGGMLGADFVICGHIHSMEDSNLVITTIINVHTSVQLAGNYFEYEDFDDIPSLLPDITAIIINASHRNTSRLPVLAVVPFEITNSGIDNRDAEILAQILTIEIANTGRFVVLPRATSMHNALAELDTLVLFEAAKEEAGIPDDDAKEEAEEEAEEEAIAEQEPDGGTETAVLLGRSVGAAYVLSAGYAKEEEGDIEHFILRILNTKDGSVFAEVYENYISLIDSIADIANVARHFADKVKITGPSIGERFRTTMLDDPSKFWSVGASVGTSFATPLVIGTIHGTASPFKNSFFDIGIDFGFVSRLKGAAYYSFYPFVHFNYFFPSSLIPSFPLLEYGSLYAGLGFGVMLANYRFDDLYIFRRDAAADVCVGYLFRDFLDISYTLRTNFSTVSNKLAVGYVWRFR